MSLKEDCKNTCEGYFLLDAGVSVPTRIFFTEKLYGASEDGLYSQIRNATEFPGVLDVAVTPDAHIGSTVPVGSVIATDGTLLHSPVGYDIGCGVLCFRSDVPVSKGRDEKLKRKWSEEVMKRVGIGVGQRGNISVTRRGLQEIIRGGADALEYRDQQTERPFLAVDDAWTAPAKALEKGMQQLCSLGGGNHFIELQYDQAGYLWGMIHTGSRGFGYQLAAHYIALSRDEMKARGDKTNGDATYFLPDSPHWNGYKNAVAAGGNFATANRLMIWEQVATAFRRVFGTDPELYYEISHNLAQEETLPDGRAAWVHRKGATRAFPAGHPALLGTKWESTGHPVLIPGSMGDASYVLFPRAGAEKSMYSVNHGCGRLLSRSEARQRFSQSGVNKQMKTLGVLVNGGGVDVPIDESPGVYKPAKDVLAAVV
ncbi:MAG: RtcB family protein, partial [Akkermansiaceae bacterium]|nr:RtcB family protein [Armatimonadota bacterium]